MQSYDYTFGNPLVQGTQPDVKRSWRQSLEAATGLFAECGPAATSIRDIVTRSKLSHGLMFLYLGS
nr:helix-turn-helix domain-containing protein [Mycobacterium uberis]